jgi:heterodisulfide reductase subunit C
VLCASLRTLRLNIIYMKQIIFAITLLITLGVFAYTVMRLVSFFKLTKANFPIRDFGKRLKVMLDVAFGQTKIFRRPIIGFMHAMVFWGFCVIIFGSIEMVIDGLFGTERVLKVFGILYQIIIASSDIFGFIIAICIMAFLFRRIFMHIKRFEGIEMKPITHIDANIALSMILFLMLSLLGMNASYVAHQTLSGQAIIGTYPVGQYLSVIFMGLSVDATYTLYQTCWWSHILLIFIFANMLPYSKHFHVFLSVPNTFLSRLEPLGKLTNMDNITREVKLMLDPNAAFATPATDAPIERFGVKDIEDVSWKNYFDSLSCTQCGRCTSVCPANITGKKLSPRKVLMDVRERMKVKGPFLVKNKDYTDNKSLIRDYISEEELWACTTCNACARECPVNINHPTLIIDLRRYLVMEEGSAPGELKAVFSNIENNGAPWQFSPEDRLLWVKDLEMNVKS